MTNEEPIGPIDDDDELLSQQCLLSPFVRTSRLRGRVPSFHPPPFPRSFSARADQGFAAHCLKKCGFARSRIEVSALLSQPSKCRFVLLSLLARADQGVVQRSLFRRRRSRLCFALPESFGFCPFSHVDVGPFSQRLWRPARTLSLLAGADQGCVRSRNTVRGNHHRRPAAPSWS